MTAAKTKNRLSVVVPAHNEATNIAAMHAAVSAAVKDLGVDLELIFVDDGSRDATAQCVIDTASRDPRIRLIALTRNFGHQAALLAGLTAATGDAVITMDCDLQHPPSLIPQMVAAWRAGNAVVQMVRDETLDAGPAKRIMSRYFYRLMNLLSDTAITPGAADFQLLDRTALDALLSLGDHRPFLRGMVSWLGFPTSYLRYVAAARASGSSTTLSRPGGQAGIAPGAHGDFRLLRAAAGAARARLLRDAGRPLVSFTGVASRRRECGLASHCRSLVPTGRTAMNLAQSIAIVVPWTMWVVYWTATSNRVKATARKEASLSRTLQSVPLIAGGALIILPDFNRAAWSFDPQSIGAFQLAGLAVLLAGLAFSVWARLHLGTNWSVSVTLKEGHELVRSGPYGLVRHPIYTGCLLALAGAVLIGMQWRGAAGLVLIFASLAYKVRVEESWLSGHFGGAYAQYRRDVAALIPGLF